MIRWAVFVSGEGSNLQNVLDLEKSELKTQVMGCVISDRECRAIERAKSAGKASLVYSPKESNWTSKVLEFLKNHKIDSLFLLGYMRILPEEFLKSWKGRLINLHPSYLPKYPGLDSVKKACAANEEFLGVTLHEVIESVDAGPILRQLSFPRNSKLSFDQIMEEVHQFERKIVKDYLLDLDEKSE